MSFYSKITVIAFLFALKATPSVSQLPVTHVYCFDMEREVATISLTNARLLTAFNPEGYNNQPCWVNNNELYISVQTPLDTNQTDILSLSVLNNTVTRITATAEAEYSPTAMPDRRWFSCVRADVSAKGSVQRLWAYPYDRSSEGRNLLPLEQNIGYHCWASDKKLALFVINGQKNYLKIVNVEDQSSIQLMPDIGRSMARMSDGKLAFIHKETEKNAYIKSLDMSSYNSETIIETLPGSEDFALMPDGTFLMGFASKLYSYNPADKDKEWREVADLAKYGLTNITRIAISREMDKIAIVNNFSMH